MRHVTFARAEPPYNKGDKRVVPDAVAAELEAKGLLASSVPFGKPDPAAQKPRRRILSLDRPRGAGDRRMAE